MTVTSLVGERLCVALRREPPLMEIQTYTEEDWGRIIQLARRLRLAPLLLERLKLSGAIQWLPESWQAELHKHYALSMNETRKRQSQVEKVLDAFQAENVDLIALKGLDLAYQVYASPAARPMVDLDILIHREDTAHSEKLLQELGYRKDIPDAQIKLLFHHLLYLPPQGTDELPLELHWDLTGIRTSSNYQPDCLWEQPRHLQILGHTVYGLSFENIILHLCVHSAFNHQFTEALRTCCDLDQLLQTPGNDPDWDLILRRAQQWEVTKPVALILNLASELLGANIPDQILNQLKLLSPEKKLAYQRVRQIALQRTALRLPEDVHGWRAMARIVTAQRWDEKLQSIREAVFPPRWAIARRYGLTISSPWVSLYYIKNLWDDLRFQGPRVWEFFRKRSPVPSKEPSPETDALWATLQEEQTIQNDLMDWMLQKGS